MSELIEGTAVVIPNATPQEQFSALNPQEKEVVAKQVEEMQAKVADDLLRSPKGWDLLRELAGMVLQKNLATSTFVLPVLHNKDAILAKLDDPVAFQKSFQTLVADLDLCTRTVQNLTSKHLSKSGQPTDAEMTDVFQLSADYNDIITKFENTIEPLMFSLIDVVRDQYGSNLDIPQPAEPAQ